MLLFILRRLLSLIPFLILASITVFILITLPPGDYLTSYAAQLSSTGDDLDAATLENLRIRYGLGEPVLVQYWKWVTGVVVGDFGYSFEWQQPVNTLIGERLALTVLLSFAALLFTWGLAMPIGIFSAVRKNTWGDYIVTLIGFIGLATPNFLLAILLMYISVTQFGQSAGGLFSPGMDNAPWSWAKVSDLMAHLWIPIIVIGTSGTASLIRVMRANLLDELAKPYVVTARAKGLSELRLLLKYPVRLALNPFISTIGWLLPSLVSGSIIVSIVLNLPMAGPLLLQSLLNQDMFLAGGFLMFLTILTVIGTLVSDILLALIDPRIRYQ